MLVGASGVGTVGTSGDVGCTIMRSAYPLLVDQNGWGVAGSSSNNRVDSTSLLRSVGVDLSRPVTHQSQPSLVHPDIEILVEDPPSIFSHEYPQPPSDLHYDSRLKRKPVGFQRAGINRSVQRLDLSNLRPELEAALLNEVRSASNPETTPLRLSGPSGSTPRGSPRSASPRSKLRHEFEGNDTVSESCLHASQMPRQSINSNSNSGSYRGQAQSLSLSSVMRPSQLSLCCSSPDYYYSTERLRQEPEPGLCACCDTKVSCCPCSPCCEAWCPVGHMNTVCTSLICCGIILFIVLSPLLHYLVPT